MSFTWSVDRINRRAGGERLSAEIVLGVKVSGHEIERTLATELLCHIHHGRSVARAKSGIDHQHATVATTMPIFGTIGTLLSGMT